MWLCALIKQKLIRSDDFCVCSVNAADSCTYGCHVEAEFSWRSDDTVILHGGSLEVAGTIHLPGTAEWEAPGGRRGVGYTLLRNSPPVGCSGVLHSEEFLALSLLLLGSLSLIMSYWRQKRAITPRRRRGWYSNSGYPPNTNQGTAGASVVLSPIMTKKASCEAVWSWFSKQIGAHLPTW